jgi:hypothetical protein
MMKKWRMKLAVLQAGLQEMRNVVASFVLLELRWLLPTLAILLLLGLGAALAGGAGPLAPFIYPLF